ncbi:unnamed protein product, partial [Heterosigma akashiwo]
MARNEEKAQAILNKWTTMKKDYEKGEDQRRPFLSSDCHDLSEAEQWRRQVIKEITKKVADIQNAGLGEHLIRDMNDQINKLLREKYHWQTRIKELGGPDYTKLEPKSFDADGRELPGTGGAAKAAGVRELFQEAAPAPPRRRGEILRGLTPDYFGFRDEEDGVLVAKARGPGRGGTLPPGVWSHPDGGSEEGGASDASSDDDSDSDSDEEGEGLAGAIAALGPSAATSAQLKALVPVPSQDAIKEAILERKKKALLARLD